MNIEQLTAIDNLRDLGFTARQAEFLYLVGTHSGVFTLNHFRTFIKSATYGGREMRLMEKLEARHFVTRIGITRTYQVIHIDNKAFYRAILAEDSRLRREMSPSLMRQRLQYMDYVSRNPEAWYLTSDESRMDLLTGQFLVPEEALPRQVYKSRKSGTTAVRYFPERFPMFVMETPKDVSLGVVYGEDPANSFQSVRKFIAANRAFFDAVPCLHFIYVSSSERRCQLTMRLLSSTFSSTHTVATPDLERYFALRKRIDDRQERTFSADDYAFWEAAFKRFRDAKYEPLYAEFCGQQSFNSVPCARRGRVFTYETFLPTTTLNEGLDAE